MTYPKADKDLLDNGRSICYFHAKADIVETWVKKVAELSGQRVDWGYSCGIADVFFIGDYDKVKAAVLKLKPELDDLCIKDCWDTYKIKLDGPSAWRLF